MSAWKRCWKRTYSTDGVLNNYVVDDAESFRNMIWGTPKEITRSSSTDVSSSGDYVKSQPVKEANASNKVLIWNPLFDTPRLIERSTSIDNVSSSTLTRPSPLRENTVSSTSSMAWTLPTNIVYGPQDLVKDPKDLEWPNSKEETASSSGIKTPSTSSTNDKASTPDTSSSKENEPEPTIVTWGPAKDFIRRYMKRSISMDGNYDDKIVTWAFPDEDEDYTVNNSSSTDATQLSRSVSQETCVVKTPQPKEDQRVVTWGLARTVPVTVKSSTFTDIVNKTAKVKSSSSKKSLQGAAWVTPKTVTRSAKRSISIDAAIRSAKRSKSIDADYCPGNVKVAPTRRYTRKAPKLAASKSVPSVVKKSTSTDEDWNGKAMSKGRSRKDKNVELAVSKDALRPNVPTIVRVEDCSSNARLENSSKKSKNVARAVPKDALSAIIPTILNKSMSIKEDSNAKGVLKGSSRKGKKVKLTVSKNTLTPSIPTVVIKSTSADKDCSGNATSKSSSQKDKNIEWVVSKDTQRPSVPSVVKGSTPTDAKSAPPPSVPSVVKKSASIDKDWNTKSTSKGRRRKDKNVELAVPKDVLSPSVPINLNKSTSITEDSNAKGVPKGSSRKGKKVKLTVSKDTLTPSVPTVVIKSTSTDKDCSGNTTSKSSSQKDKNIEWVVSRDTQRPSVPSVVKGSTPTDAKGAPPPCVLRVVKKSTTTTEDCSSKATSKTSSRKSKNVEWTISKNALNPSVSSAYKELTSTVEDCNVKATSKNSSQESENVERAVPNLAPRPSTPSVVKGLTSTDKATSSSDRKGENVEWGVPTDSPCPSVPSVIKGSTPTETKGAPPPSVQRVIKKSTLTAEDCNSKATSKSSSRKSKNVERLVLKDTARLHVASVVKGPTPTDAPPPSVPSVVIKSTPTVEDCNIKATSKNNNQKSENVERAFPNETPRPSAPNAIKEFTSTDEATSSSSRKDKNVERAVPEDSLIPIVPTTVNKSTSINEDSNAKGISKGSSRKGKKVKLTVSKDTLTPSVPTVVTKSTSTDKDCSGNATSKSSSQKDKNIEWVVSKDTQRPSVPSVVKGSTPTDAKGAPPPSVPSDVKKSAPTDEDWNTKSTSKGRSRKDKHVERAVPKDTLSPSVPTVVKKSTSTDKDCSANAMSRSSSQKDQNIEWVVSKDTPRPRVPSVVKGSTPTDAKGAPPPSVPSDVKKSAPTDEDWNTKSTSKGRSRKDKHVERAVRKDTRSLSVPSVKVSTSSVEEPKSKKSSQKSENVDCVVPKATPHPIKRPASKDSESSEAKLKRSLSIDCLGGSASEMWTQKPKVGTKLSVKTNFEDEYYNTGLVKRSRSLDDARSPKPVARVSRKDIPSPAKRCASKNQNTIPANKVRRSLSIDGTSSSSNTTEKVFKDVTSTPVSPFFREEYYNTGLVRRSSKDGARSPFFREEYYNTGLVKRSRSIDGAKSPKNVTRASPKHTPSRGRSKMKRSHSSDGRENVKRVRWASPTELTCFEKYVPGKVQRSVSTDCSSKSMTWVPKSILKESVYKDEYYNTGMVRRSRSMDGAKSPKTVLCDHCLKHVFTRSSSPTEIPDTNKGKKSSQSKNEIGSSKRMTRSAFKKQVEKSKKESGTTRSVRRSNDVSFEIETSMIEAASNDESMVSSRNKASMTSIEASMVRPPTKDITVKSIIEASMTRFPATDKTARSIIEARMARTPSIEAIMPRLPSIDMTAKSIIEASMTRPPDKTAKSIIEARMARTPSTDKTAKSIIEATMTRPPVTDKPSKSIIEASITRPLATDKTVKSIIEARLARTPTDKPVYSEIEASIPRSSAKENHTISLLEAILTNKDTSILNEVNKSVVQAASTSKNVVRTATTSSIIEVKSWTRKDVNDANKEKISSPVCQAKPQTKLKPSLSWDAAITIEDRNRFSLSKAKRSISRDCASSSVDVKRSTSTDTMTTSRERNNSKDATGTAKSLTFIAKKSVPRDEMTGSKLERSVSSDGAVNDNELKRTKSTDTMKEKVTSCVDMQQIELDESFLDKNSLIYKELKKFAYKEAMKAKVSSHVDEEKSSKELKRSASSDAMREKISLHVDEEIPLFDKNSLIYKELKKFASRDAKRKEKTASKVVKETVVARKPSSDDEPSSSRTNRKPLSKDTKRDIKSSSEAEKSSKKAPKSTEKELKSTKKSEKSTTETQKSTKIAQILSIKDEDLILSELIATLCEDDDESLRGGKRTASEENTDCPSKIKRSNSKDDVSNSRDSKRDSGISISEGSSEPKRKTKDRNYKPKMKYKKKKIKRENFDCAICSKPFKGMTDLRRHLLIHANEKPYVCKICNKAYRQKINLQNHMKVEHSKEKEFVCRYCAKSFPLKQRLKIHVRTHIGEKPFSCSLCTKTFARNAQLQQHLASHDESVQKSCDLSPSKFRSEKTLEKHKGTHSPKDFVCQLCGTSFDSEMLMRSHISSTHGSVTNFECQICEKKIIGDLDTHMKTHAIARPHECEECKRVFATKAQYNVHKRTHTGERPYQCRVCWQSFGHSNVLKLHIRKHTGEKPFKCVLCSGSLHVAFSQLSHLKTHMRTIHKEEGAYICEGCRECFLKKFHLEIHVKTCEEVQSNPKILTGEQQKEAEKDADLLGRLRYLMAVLLKKISTPEKLTVLGFEKRLIDNVVIASLKLANQKVYDSKNINELDQMKLNIEAFLEWIVPKNVMNAFKKECPSIENILEKIVSMYTKQVD